MNKLRKMIEKIEKEMTAVSFAEAGEFETAREMLKPEETVLLVLSGHEREEKSMKYALSFCKRMGAALEILYGTASQKRAGHFFEELKQNGIKYEVRETKGCLKQAVVDITNQNREIHYVVINSQKNFESGCERASSMLLEMRRLINCPLIVVGT